MSESGRARIIAAAVGVVLVAAFVLGGGCKGPEPEAAENGQGNAAPLLQDGSPPAS